MENQSSFAMRNIRKLSDVDARTNVDNNIKSLKKKKDMKKNK